MTKNVTMVYFELFIQVTQALMTMLVSFQSIHLCLTIRSRLFGLSNQIGGKVELGKQRNYSSSRGREN